MNKLNSKMIAIFLSLILLYSGMNIYSESARERFLGNGLKSYQKGDYEEAVFHFRSALELTSIEQNVKRAKIYLLVASCYSEMRNSVKSKEVLDLLKKLIMDNNLKGIPEVFVKNKVGNKIMLDPGSIAGYTQVFGEKNFRVKKLIEKPGKKRSTKKKKRLVLAITVGVIVAIVAAIQIFKKKKNKKSDDEPYRDIEWVTIPAGEFWMGDDKNIGDPDERPLHKVYLDEYSISKYEVTFEQYDLFCDETGREKPGNQVSQNEALPRTKFPVINISYEDAEAYCNWLSKKLGKNVHLPTEAQWEKAARGTDKRTYPWGNESPDSTLLNWSTLSYAKPKIVGSYPNGKSPYGVYDMAGNVWEYCMDWYDSNYYSISPNKNPPGPATGIRRVIRGGGYYRPDGSCRVTYRGGDIASIKSNSLGFRPVMEN